MQVYGVDYHKTYAPVACLASFHFLIAIANRNRWPLDSFDFNSTYLNSVLGEDKVVYLEQLRDYPQKNLKHYVFHFVKALYGLKQAAKSWYDSLSKALCELDFI